MSVSKENLTADADALDRTAVIADYCAALDHENQAKIEENAVTLRAWSTWLRTLAENES